MKCSWENEILRGILRVVSRFPLHFVLVHGNFNYFLDSAVIVLDNKTMTIPLN